MALAGPFGSAILADLGADVIKVEPPTGDMSRPSPPTPPDFINPAQGKAGVDGGCDFGGYFGSINRNKRSISLDLKDEADRETFLCLCEQADAVLENMRAGVMDRLGLSYETIRERNPRIVYAALRGFGDPRTGESPHGRLARLRHRGPGDGRLRPHQRPRGRRRNPEGGYPGGASVGDLFPGTLMALAVVAGVHHARRTGKGQFMDVAMVDGVNLLCESLFANYGAAKSNQLGPRGRHHHSLCPFGIFDAKDGGRGGRRTRAGPVGDPLPRDGAAGTRRRRTHEGLRGPPQAPGVRGRRRLRVDRRTYPRPGRRGRSPAGSPAARCRPRPTSSRAPTPRSARWSPKSSCRATTSRSGSSAARFKYTETKTGVRSRGAPARRAPRRDPRPIRDRRRDRRRAGPGRPAQGE